MRKWPLLLCCWVNLVFRAYFWGMGALIRSYCFTVCFFLASNCTLKASPAVESMLSNVSLYFDIFLLNLTFILLLFQRGHIAVPQSHPCCTSCNFFSWHCLNCLCFICLCNLTENSCIGLADWAKQDHWGSDGQSPSSSGTEKFNQKRCLVLWSHSMKGYTRQGNR